MEGDCNVYAHSSLWMRPTGEWSINAKMVYTFFEKLSNPLIAKKMPYLFQKKKLASTVWYFQEWSVGFVFFHPR